MCIDARHAAAALQAGLRNKSDRNDARGIAQLMRLNAFRTVWVKSPQSQRTNAMLTARNTLQEQIIRVENVIRGLLRCDGVTLPPGCVRFEAEVRSRPDGRQATEVAVAADVLNRMLDLGRPEYVRVV